MIRRMARVTPSGPCFGRAGLFSSGDISTIKRSFGAALNRHTAGALSRRAGLLSASNVSARTAIRPSDRLLSETSIMLCCQVEQPFGRGLNFRFSEPGRATARISSPSCARRHARCLSEWLGRRHGESHPGVRTMSQAIAPPPTSAFALPPGPMAPAWWQLVRFAGDPLGLLAECQRRYGDTFTR
jgi:hypothetical protein